MPNVVKRSHGDIYVYLELYKQKRRADDKLEFSRGGGGGGGGGHLPVLIID